VTGGRQNGGRRGRPRQCPDEVLVRVVTYRMEGLRLVDICERLNADAVPTPAGGARWHPSHVSRLLRTQDAQHLKILDLSPVLWATQVGFRGRR
jgi:Recombinase